MVKELVGFIAHKARQAFIGFIKRRKYMLLRGRIKANSKPHLLYLLSVPGFLALMEDGFAIPKVAMTCRPARQAKLPDRVRHKSR
ncbi:hypothetical protein LR021_02925 [Candidatus Bipolaricaulota bacterium]|nr:hypothetical protein [Candidatus Bipolaricaulota bacterium]